MTRVEFILHKGARKYQIIRYPGECQRMAGRALSNNPPLV
jgi:hypothetical protein